LNGPGYGPRPHCAQVQLAMENTIVRAGVENIGTTTVHTGHGEHNSKSRRREHRYNSSAHWPRLVALSGCCTCVLYASSYYCVRHASKARSSLRLQYLILHRSTMYPPPHIAYTNYIDTHRVPIRYIHRTYKHVSSSSHHLYRRTSFQSSTYIVHTSMYPPPHTIYIDARCSNQVHTSYIQACILLLTPFISTHVVPIRYIHRTY
jgi:hypothetical protein